ncbi:MAG TPA: class I SAM-dependent methyltransferase [Bryobacteraceae bacterium]|nr:class I SAM-dependent methyltransferase [Bryobacteraceae bacterium]
MHLKPEDVATYYDTWTRSYLDAFGPCIQAHRPSSDEHFLAYLANRIGLVKGMRALDAGCGVCGPARFFAQRTGASIEAVTVSPVQARIAAAEIAAASLEDRIRVTVGDFHDLAATYGQHSFDVVYFLESLSHSADPARAIRSAHEVLKPGGRIYIKDFFVRPCDTDKEQRQVLDVVARVDTIFRVKTAWAKEMLGHLEAAGFSREFVEHPGFSVDNTRWQVFERVNGIDLFAGKDSFDWSEWFEMRFRKLGGRI